MPNHRIWTGLLAETRRPFERSWGSKIECIECRKILAPGEIVYNLAFRVNLICEKCAEPLLTIEWLDREIRDA